MHQPSHSSKRDFQITFFRRLFCILFHGGITGVAHAQRSTLLRAAGADPVIQDFRSFSFSQLQAYFR